MPTVSVIMPVYNVAAFVADAVRSVLCQTFSDFELIIVDDCSPDDSIRICEHFDDQRILIIRHQHNRGLAGARNSGIRAARGKLLAFIDSDDQWEPEKLALHVTHLLARPDVGISFSRSAFIDAEGHRNHCYQMPQLTDISAGYLFCRNPIGNGSAPVIRREVMDQIAFIHHHEGQRESCYFDPTLRQSEDIECWTRIALTTNWLIEGIPQPLTLYRLNAGGLSAQLLKQLDSWEVVAAKTGSYAPDFIDRWGATARAFQLRYLARQAIRLRDGAAAVALFHRGLRCSLRIVLQEPLRTLTTAGAAYVLKCSPAFYRWIEGPATAAIGLFQRHRIGQDLSK